MPRRPIYVAGLFFNPTFFFSCDFNFDGEVMEGFLTRLQRMVPNSSNYATITREMEMHKLGIGLIG